MVNLTPTEHLEQVAFCSWLDWKHIAYASIPNGTNKGYAMQHKFKSEGLKKGFPDLLVFLPSVIVFIEMKRKKGSVISNEQKEWQVRINSYSYAKAYICYGADDAMATIEKLL